MQRNGHRNKASTRYPVPTIIRRPSRRPLGLRDPAYVADTPHDLWLAMQRDEKFPSTRSAEELEAWLRRAPELAELLALGLLERARYDGLGQLLAKTILEHYGRHPHDVRVPAAVQRELGKSNPQLVAQVSTFHWLWAFAAAGRVWDAHQRDD